MPADQPNKERDRESEYKQILDGINKRTQEKINVNLWRNTEEVITWFQFINNKHRHKFISFDVVEYYPSITEELLNKALDFTTKFDTIHRRGTQYHHPCEKIVPVL